MINTNERTEPITTTFFCSRDANQQFNQKQAIKVAASVRADCVRIQKCSWLVHARD